MITKLKSMFQYYYAIIIACVSLLDRTIFHTGKEQYIILLCITLIEIIYFCWALRDKNKYWRIISFIRLILILTVCTIFWFLNSKYN